MKKKFTAPLVTSMEVATQQMIAASSGVNIETPAGVVFSFGYCSKSGCKTSNPLTWDENASDNRDKREFVQVGDNIWDYDYVKVWHYIGCYQLTSTKDNDCQPFYNVTACVGEQYDLFINAKGEYYAEPCADGKH